MFEITPPPSFKEDAESYGSVGFFISEASRFELALDEFIISFAKAEPGIAKSLSRDYPRTAMKKVDFLVKLLLISRRLRDMPMDADGFWSLSYLFYSSEQLFDVRNHLAHGAIDNVHDNEGHLSWYASKVSLEKPKEGKGVTVGVVRYGFSERFLERIFGDIRLLRKYVDNLRRYFENGESWEHHYQQQKKLIENRRLLQKMGVSLPFLPEDGRITITIKSDVVEP